jgi:DNA replication and repair protein RecF
VGAFGQALRVSDAVGTLAMVFILPEDINITSGSPRHHRSFLDIYLSQLSHKYLLNLMEYQKVLKQRNALLRKLKSGEENIRHLDSWDESLIGPALNIMAARAAFLEKLKPDISEISSKLLNISETVNTSYQPRLSITDFTERKGALAALRSERSKDLKLGASFSGPHRDLIDISVGGRPFRNFGSLGQKKCVMIALKLAAFKALSANRGEPAILVLDEAFAALDKGRSLALLGLLSGIGQVFLATATATGLENNAKLYDVDAGGVTQNNMDKFHVSGN